MEISKAQPSVEKFPLMIVAEPGTDRLLVVGPHGANLYLAVVLGSLESWLARRRNGR